MSQQIALNAQTGRELGSSSSRRLRREGRIPAVVYGLESDPLAVSVEYSEARLALTGDAGLNALLNLTIDGNDQLCLVKDIQRHIVRDEVSHIDFIRVDPNADFELEIPLILVGESKAVANLSGMVDQALFSVVISTKPTSIPNEIEVDISEMEVGESIRVADLKFPEGVKAAMAAETTVATAVVTRSTLDAMRADEEAEAAEVAEAGAPADGDAGDE
jgi:large subunit ribosomal protein L25